MRPFRITTTLTAANTSGIAQAQSRSTAGAFTFNGSDVSGGVVTYTNPSPVAMTSTGNETNKTFRVTGTVLFGSPVTAAESVTELLIPTVASSARTVNFFYTVTGITSDNATVGTLTWGTDGTQSSAIGPVDYLNTAFNVGVEVEILSGTANYTHQQTGTNVFQTPLTLAPFWFDGPDSAIVAKAASGVGVSTRPCMAMRLKINSGTAGSVVSMKIVQAGCG